MARPSLVDATETALRERLAPGRARPGDRLPPEKELAEALGVSRGHAAAGARAAGEQRRDRPPPGQRHVRRAGRARRGVQRGARGARVLRLAGPPAGQAAQRPQPAGRAGAHARLRRRGPRDAPRDQGAADPAHAARRRDGRRAHARHRPPRRRPAAARGAPRGGRRRGRWCSTSCVERGVPIAFARTQVRPRLVEPGSRLGDAMGADPCDRGARADRGHAPRRRPGGSVLDRASSPPARSTCT